MPFGDAIIHNSKLLLRAMLFSLVAAGVLGAVAAMFGSSDVVGQTVGTLITLSISCALLLFVSTKLSKLYEAQLLAALFIYAEFILILFAIWMQDLIGFSNQLFEHIIALIFCLAAAAIPSVICLCFLRQPVLRVAARTGPVLWLIVFLLWNVANILGPDTSAAEDWWSYGATFACFGFLATLCLVGVGTDHRRVRWLGVLAAAAAFVVAAYNIAGDHRNPEPLTALITLAALVAVANLLYCAPLRSNQRWLAYLCLATSAVSALFINLSAIDHAPERNSTAFLYSTYDRAAASSTILAACSLLGVAIMVFLNRWTAPPPRNLDLVKDVEINVVCPVCRHKQTFGKEGGTCAGCGLKIKVTVEEPRCPACGYSLLMNKSDRCPECGASVTSSPTPGPDISPC